MREMRHKIQKPRKFGRVASGAMPSLHWGLLMIREGRFPLWEDQAALAAAVQNMYLMCTAHGIGGFWSTPGFLEHPVALEALGHEPGVQGMGLFYMGYPEGDWPSKGHRKPLEYVTRWKSE